MLTASHIAVALCASAQGTMLSLAGWRMGCGVSGQNCAQPGGQRASKADFGMQGVGRIGMPSDRLGTSGSEAGGTGDYRELD